MPSLISNAITNGIQEAEKHEEMKELGDHSNAMQAAYRKLQFMQYALQRSEGDRYQHTPQHITVRLDKTYNDHTGILDPNPHVAFKAGFTSKPTFLIRVKAELADLLRAGGTAKVQTRRAHKAAIADAFATSKQGMRRSYAAARKPPQQQLTAIRNNNEPCFTPHDIDQAYDDKLGAMFEREEAGACRRKARAAALFQQYHDICPE